MAYQPANSYIDRYQPAQPVRVRHFDYSKLPREQIFMLHTTAVVSRHLTKAQREHLINLNFPHTQN